MTILASLFALVGRFFGKLLTTTLGWASVLSFGRVPQRRQVWLAVLTFGSLRPATPLGHPPTEGGTPWTRSRC